MPSPGRVRPATCGSRPAPGRGFELRRQVVGDTLVYFTIDEDAARVNIMRIWPARRRPLEAEDFAFDEEPTLVDDEEP